ncbi:MAG: hypothetical protein K2X03_25040 [Bryobacteraceae bacterium]|nr:hypothetical protein [Bryobacteraceae bacterium]
MKPGKTDELFRDLTQVRGVLAERPLAVEECLGPLRRAVEYLETQSLPPEARERLRREVSGVGQLLDGFAQWLAVLDVASPTYNRRAAMVPIPGACLVAEG